MKHTSQNAPASGTASRRSLAVGGLALGLIGGLMVQAGSAMAASPSIVALSDPELAQMRGRFIAADNRVMYFGVEMISQWQTPSGTMSAGLTVGIDQSGGHPEVTFQPTLAIEGSPEAQTSGRHVVAGGSRNDSRGVRQQIQVAGNDNRANNVMEVLIEPHQDARQGSSGQNGDYRVEVSQGGTVIASGLSSSGRNAGVSMQMGNSLVRQGIQNGNASQVIQLAGNHQAVHNQLRLLVGVDPSKAAGPDQLHGHVARSLATLRGIR